MRVAWALHDEFFYLKMPVFTKPNLQLNRMQLNAILNISATMQLRSGFVCCYRTNTLCIGMEHWQRFGARCIKKKIKSTIFFTCTLYV